MNTLIIGSGGREHALAWKIGQSDLVDKVFVAPGNGGTEREFTNLKIDILKFEQVANAILENEIGLVVVGPEQPLVDGIIDFFEQHSDPKFKSVHFIGPNKACAMLEGSKEFSKRVMKEAGIPTAKAVNFTSEERTDCQQYIENHALPVVIKADGLAAGKGVAVCFSTEDAVAFAHQVLVEKAFGEGNDQLLVEDFLKGIEVSMFVLTDGTHYHLLPEAKDYKRIFDNDLGPNTGGMGSVSPVPFVDEIFQQKVKNQVIDPLFNTLKNKGLIYKGFLFIGLMNDNGEPSVVEFNARLGDPETETILQRIQSDLVPAFLSIKDQKLNEFPVSISPEAAATVVICAENYPETPVKGDEISFMKSSATGQYFHAGTIVKDGKLVSNGGRVMACTAKGENLSAAIRNAYYLAENQKFRGMQYRNDIGQDVLNLS